MKTVLSIAGSDPSGGAGIQVDLQTFQRLGVRGITVITALTSQNDRRFFSLNPVSSLAFKEQLRAVVDRYRVDAVRIGVLASADVALAAYRFLDSAKPPSVVLDPVMKSSTGAILLEPKGVGILKEFLIPRATVVTPNLDEAEALTKMKVRSVDQMKEAALNLHTTCKGVKAVLVKGGHLKDEVADVLFDGCEFIIFESKRKFPRRVHGTGCALAGALAAYLARGYSLEKSVRQAREYVIDWIRSQS